MKQELSVVEETGTASVFLFFYDTVSALKEDGEALFTYLAERNGYAVCKAYVIGLTFLGFL